VRRSLTASTLVAVGLTLGTSGTAASAGARPATAPDPTLIDVVSFNVLAPIWAGPQWYPDDLDPAVLDADGRREAVVSYLRGVRDDADLVCLQEVQESEFGAYSAALGAAFEGAMADNDPNFWADWLTDVAWQPNGTAVFVRSTAITLDDDGIRDVPLAGTGNHAAVAIGEMSDSGAPVRIASVHLDSDSQVNRLREVDSLFDEMPAETGSTDIVCGDINEGTSIGALQGRFGRAGFVDVLAADGTEEPTHPFRDSYNRSPRWGVIDHVLVRDGHPVSGRVVDGGVWTIEDNTERIAEALRLFGSDHFPIEATVAVSR
jgi:endonuclease/exonuclease/phosphatase family metal-dependent hydrolase